MERTGALRCHGTDLVFGNALTVPAVVRQVTMDWEQLDGSIVDESLGGFDAYSTEHAAARGVMRPSWAHKLLLYQRGEVTVGKR